MTTGVLIGYPQTDSSVGNTAAFTFMDARFGNVYGGATSAPAGLRKWDAYPNGDAGRVRSVTDLDNGIENNVTIYFPHTITYRTQQLIVSAGTSNSAKLYGFSLMDMSLVSQFGVNNSDLDNSEPTRILASAQICAFSSHRGRDIVVATPILSGTGTDGAELNCVYWPGVNVKLNIPENHAALGAIPGGGGSVCWALGYSGSTDPMTLYTITTDPATDAPILTTIGTFSPSDIDPSWTSVNAVNGVTIDQTDGNPICAFGTGGTATHVAYFVKFDAATGAILWRVAVAGSSGGLNYDRSDMQKNLVVNGTIYYFGFTANTFWTIDTKAGTATATSITNASPSGYQHSEDRSGSVIWYGSYSEAMADPPEYIGTYCGTDGNRSGTAMGWRYWPVAPDPSPLAGLDPPSSSRKRAWSFTLDGHTFYVLDLGQEGTFIWDKTTNSWAQFITKGYTQWNFCNGCMWGQRIVAGDQLTTDVWEMLPASSLFDNGATEIVHIVSGGIATRNRIYHSVESFTLAASVATLLDPSGATVQLSFSDDQGKTWEDMDVLPLTNDSTQEIAWTSLGAFCNPGRVFKITDTGGFLRIDGADANIDNFDEQPPAGNGA